MKFKKDRQHFFNKTANCANAIRNLEERLESGMQPSDFFNEEQPLSLQQREAIEANLKHLKIEQVKIHKEFCAWIKSN
jgi:hypothetical protein